ncbi:LacI family DNA-binding transcriptional regulator [Streptacidiphilus sp. N1-12]|uniref:LacI family DNA-binding transcriptional regulator n=2 Tax=Streptacidiphilus alkalitolerans TaxID=3342712 RepID=A0ABV6V8E6_9ACTN
MNQQPTAPTGTPTSADVARLAGVSRATVSYVLNDTAGGRVGEQTRQRVRAAAEELGYIPHAAARSLRAGHSGIVLLATPEITLGPLFSEFFTELRAGLRDHGYTAVIYGDNSGDGGDRAESAARIWAELRPTAVLAGVGTPLTPRSAELLRRSGTRAVITLADPPVAGVHALVLDQRRIGATAAEHLLARGHRALGVVVPTDRSLDLFSLPRLAGVREAVDGGIRVERLDLDYTEQAAARLAADWPGLGLSALFSYNDEYAMLLMSAFQDAGIGIPDEVALVGADDLMLARLLRPRLTSVQQLLPPGRTLADLIDRLIRHPDTPPEIHDLGTARIAVRDSS